MVISWWRNLVKGANPKAETSRGGRRRRVPSHSRRRPCLERFEDRVVPAAFLSMPSTGLSGAQSTTVMAVPININSLDDGAGHTGLSSAQFAILYNPTVFNFPGDSR